MIKLKSLISEETFNQMNAITIHDVDNALNNKWFNRDAKITLGILSDYYYDDDVQKRGLALEYLNILNKVYLHIIEIVTKLNVPYVETKLLKQHLLELHEFRFKLEEFFPVPIYISAGKNNDGDWASIGIMVDQTGKVLEIHEGNDEATPETNALANKLVSPSGKKERIYASHDTQLVHKIDETGYLPANLYVSPDRNHASGYMDIEGTRSMFTGIIDTNDVAHESDLDWRTLGTVKIEKFRWI